MASSEFRARVVNQKTVWSAGAYDTLSARFIEAAGFDAVMTSGFGVSASLLGQPDAELYTMSENLGVARNVVAAVRVPVVADIDTGYGNAINVMRTIREFEAAGVSAVIMEDQIAPKRCPICVAGVEVIDKDEAVAKIQAAVAARRNPDMLIIARTDVVDEAEAIDRAKAYVAAGADVIQPISKCFKSIEGLRALREGCGVPLSLQILGWLEKNLSRQEVESVAGMATFALVPLMTVAAALRENLAVLAAEKSSRNLPRPVMAHDPFVEFIGFGEVEELQKKYLRSR
ncbi:carboxyvinyl-carboxyphosphonate phosphorylmutase [Prosthecomicrobium hirschii]|uniref:Carboxyvinyl-carboxyphosphonate phosphorylmutase n=1 Tax=Prosthecodimorpha hirschii TaxID=665126 RepID=A0A0P6VQN5_9HYPH|nr:isocitrate lyase/PEP mutase family protein [Prosthecomicrobium hirschii]KPL53524.1 carboxyvinyl-carboxyphosphonate phosphorylmutase [Prosthecomicrobium hirschii]TPQ49595.1 carboxyvinyl-carboxyphosphonate phosphorylmutase [Prosthecomicrobium hirschii]